MFHHDFGDTVKALGEILPPVDFVDTYVPWMGIWEREYPALGAQRTICFEYVEESLGGAAVEVTAGEEAGGTACEREKEPSCQFQHHDFSHKT